MQLRTVRVNIEVIVAAMAQNTGRAHYAHHRLIGVLGVVSNFARSSSE